MIKALNTHIILFTKPLIIDTVMRKKILHTEKQSGTTLTKDGDSINVKIEYDDINMLIKKITGMPYLIFLWIGASSGYSLSRILTALNCINISNPVETITVNVLMMLSQSAVFIFFYFYLRKYIKKTLNNLFTN